MASRVAARTAVGLAGMAAGATARQSRAEVARLVRKFGGDPAGGALPTAFDPQSRRVLADPYPAYAELNEGPALRYNSEAGLWFLSRYDEVRTAARAHERLSSAESVAPVRSRQPMMLTSDRPDHTRLRRLVARDFTRDALERRRPMVERLAQDAVGEMLAARESDAVAALASPLPVLVIANILGIPPADTPSFRDWSDRLVRGFAVAPGARWVRDSAVALGAALKLRSYLDAQFEQRRRDPGDDILSALLSSAEDGSLEDEEVFWFALLLLVAGNETTTSLLGTMLLSFAQHPDQYARVREDPSLIGPAVEEALRHTSPIQGLYRTALSPYEVGKATVPAGGRVLLLFGAANRDPRKYSDPARFLVDRNPTDHVAFGSGIHFCLGAHLARIEASVVLRELAERVSSIELAGNPIWMRNPSLRGLTSLPLRLQPA